MKLRIILGLVAILMIAQVAVGLLRPLPPLVFTSSIDKTINGQDLTISWPAAGQSAISINESSALSSTQNQVAIPTASTIKVLTALVVLNKYLLAANEQGPTITLTQADVDSYNYYFRLNGSIVPVAVGEKITELEALEAMLIPSGNNMADTLAVWAYGSIDNYLVAANNYAKNIGMNTAVIADASGLSGNTKASASDMVKLATVAIQNPVIAKIVAMQGTVIPVAGTIKNTNSLLGSPGVVGLKTGTSDDAGGCFLLSIQKTVGSKLITQNISVLGQTGRTAAISLAQNLADQGWQNYEPVNIAKGGSEVGVIAAKWQRKQIAVVSSKDIDVLRWKNIKIKVTAEANLKNSNSLSIGKKVGVIKAVSESESNADISVSSDLKPPTIWWKIIHNGIIR